MLNEYKDGITLITPTGDRPICLERCIFYMERQTLKPDQWIIVDDGDTPSYKGQSDTIDYVRRKYCNDKAKSLTGNLIAACRYIRHNKVLIIEDDDWYSPNYIEIVSKRLNNVGITGEKQTIYYNVAKRVYRQNQNTKHSSLCATAFHSRFICKFKKYCEVNRRSAFVDARFWLYARENGIPSELSSTSFCVGIKGMPGRLGIGIGHRPGWSYTEDRQLAYLRKLIGSDADFYATFFKSGK